MRPGTADVQNVSSHSYHCHVEVAFLFVFKIYLLLIDGIPVELFQILKDDDVKVLHSICQQIWKTQQWPQD